MEMQSVQSNNPGQKFKIAHYWPNFLKFMFSMWVTSHS